MSCRELATQSWKNWAHTWDSQLQEAMKLILSLDEENRDQCSWRPEPGSPGDEGARVCSSPEQNPGEIEPGSERNREKNLALLTSYPLISLNAFVESKQTCPRKGQLTRDAEQSEEEGRPRMRTVPQGNGTFLLPRHLWSCSGLSIRKASYWKQHKGTVFPSWRQYFSKKFKHITYELST